MPPFAQKLVIAAIAFFLPVATVCLMHREELRPYVVADPQSARDGQLLYFARRG